MSSQTIRGSIRGSNYSGSLPTSPANVSSAVSFVIIGRLFTTRGWIMKSVKEEKIQFRVDSGQRYSLKGLMQLTMADGSS